jgi:hypothetical protein
LSAGVEPGEGRALGDGVVGCRTGFRDASDDGGFVDAGIRQALLFPLCDEEDVGRFGRREVGCRRREAGRNLVEVRGQKDFSRTFAVGWVSEMCTFFAMANPPGPEVRWRLGTPRRRTAAYRLVRGIRRVGPASVSFGRRGGMILRGAPRGSRGSWQEVVTGGATRWQVLPSDGLRWPACLPTCVSASIPACFPRFNALSSTLLLHLSTSIVAQLPRFQCYPGTTG